MKIAACKILSKQGKEYTKMTATIGNFRDPGNPGEIAVSMSEDARDMFARLASVETNENGDEMLVMYVIQCESEMEMRAESWEKGKPPIRKLHFFTITAGDAPEVREYKDVFEIRNEITE